MRKSSRFIVPLGIVALCAGCGGTSLAPAPRLGTIEGFATPCVEMATLSAYNRLPVSVELHLAGRVVSRHSGKGTVTFRYLVPPGRYVVSSRPKLPKGDGESSFGKHCEGRFDLGVQVITSVPDHRISGPYRPWLIGTFGRMDSRTWGPNRRNVNMLSLTPCAPFHRTVNRPRHHPITVHHEVLPWFRTNE